MPTEEIMSRSDATGCNDNDDTFSELPITLLCLALQK
jgi:hypothetical protein